jgi:hypothetical protein
VILRRWGCGVILALVAASGCQQIDALLLAQLKTETQLAAREAYTKAKAEGRTEAEAYQRALDEAKTTYDKRVTEMEAKAEKKAQDVVGGISTRDVVGTGIDALLLLLLGGGAWRARARRGQYVREAADAARGPPKE